MTNKRQIKGQKFNVEKLVADALAATSNKLNLAKAEDALRYFGNKAPTATEINAYARDAAALRWLTDETGANFWGQIGKISFASNEKAVQDVNDYLSRRVSGLRAGFSAKYLVK